MCGHMLQSSEILQYTQTLELPLKKVPRSIVKKALDIKPRKKVNRENKQYQEYKSEAFYQNFKEFISAGYLSSDAVGKTLNLENLRDKNYQLCPLEQDFREREDFKLQLNFGKRMFLTQVIARNQKQRLGLFEPDNNQLVALKKEQEKDKQLEFVQRQIQRYTKSLNSVFEKALEKSEDYVSKDLRDSILEIISILNNDIKSMNDYSLYSIWGSEQIAQKELNKLIETLIKVFNKQILGDHNHETLLDLIINILRVTADPTYLLFLLYVRIKNPYYRKIITEEKFENIVEAMDKGKQILRDMIKNQIKKDKNNHSESSSDEDNSDEDDMDSYMESEEGEDDSFNVSFGNNSINESDTLYDDHNSNNESNDDFDFNNDPALNDTKEDQNKMTEVEDEVKKIEITSQELYPFNLEKLGYHFPIEQCLEDNFTLEAFARDEHYYYIILRNNKKFKVAKVGSGDKGTFKAEILKYYDSILLDQEEVKRMTAFCYNGKVYIVSSKLNVFQINENQGLIQNVESLKMNDIKYKEGQKIFNFIQNDTIYFGMKKNKFIIYKFIIESEDEQISKFSLESTFKLYAGIDDQKTQECPSKVKAFTINSDQLYIIMSGLYCNQFQLINEKYFLVKSHTSHQSRNLQGRMSQFRGSLYYYTKDKKHLTSCQFDFEGNQGDKIDQTSAMKMSIKSNFGSLENSPMKSARAFHSQQLNYDFEISMIDKITAQIDQFKISSMRNSKYQYMVLCQLPFGTSFTKYNIQLQCFIMIVAIKMRQEGLRNSIFKLLSKNLTYMKTANVPLKQIIQTDYIAIKESIESIFSYLQQKSAIPIKEELGIFALLIDDECSTKYTSRLLNELEGLDNKQLIDRMSIPDQVQILIKTESGLKFVIEKSIQILRYYFQLFDKNQYEEASQYQDSFQVIFTILQVKKKTELFRSFIQQILELASSNIAKAVEKLEKKESLEDQCEILRTFLRFIHCKGLTSVIDQVFMIATCQSQIQTTISNSSSLIEFIQTFINATEEFKKFTHYIQTVEIKKGDEQKPDLAFFSNGMINHLKFCFQPLGSGEEQDLVLQTNQLKDDQTIEIKSKGIQSPNLDKVLGLGLKKEATFDCNIIIKPFFNIRDSFNYMKQLAGIFKFISERMAIQIMKESIKNTHQSNTKYVDEDFKALTKSAILSAGVEQTQLQYLYPSQDKLYQQILKSLDKEEKRKIQLQQRKVNEDAQEFLLTLIESNENKSIDQFFGLLQRLFVKKNIWARLGGKQADKVVRAAFAAMVKFSDHHQDLQFTVEQFQQSQDISDDQMVKLISEMQDFERFTILYAQASQMRKILQEKKKDLAEKFGDQDIDKNYDHLIEKVINKCKVLSMQRPPQQWDIQGLGHGTGNTSFKKFKTTDDIYEGNREEEASKVADITKQLMMIKQFSQQAKRSPITNKDVKILKTIGKQVNTLLGLDFDEAYIKNHQQENIQELLLKTIAFQFSSIAILKKDGKLNHDFLYQLIKALNGEKYNSLLKYYNEGSGDTLETLLRTQLFKFLNKLSMHFKGENVRQLSLGLQFLRYEIQSNDHEYIAPIINNLEQLWTKEFGSNFYHHHLSDLMTADREIIHTLQIFHDQILAQMIQVRQSDEEETKGKSNTQDLEKKKSQVNQSVTIELYSNIVQIMRRILQIQYPEEKIQFFLKFPTQKYKMDELKEPLQQDQKKESKEEVNKEGQKDQKEEKKSDVKEEQKEDALETQDIINEITSNKTKSEAFDKSDGQNSESDKDSDKDSRNSKSNSIRDSISLMQSRQKRGEEKQEDEIKFEDKELSYYGVESHSLGSFDSDRLNYMTNSYFPADKIKEIKNVDMQGSAVFDLLNSISKLSQLAQTSSKAKLMLLKVYNDDPELLPTVLSYLTISPIMIQKLVMRILLNSLDLVEMDFLNEAVNKMPQNSKYFMENYFHSISRSSLMDYFSKIPLKQFLFTHWVRIQSQYNENKKSDNYLHQEKYQIGVLILDAFRLILAHKDKELTPFELLKDAYESKDIKFLDFAASVLTGHIQSFHQGSNVHDSRGNKFIVQEVNLKEQIINKKKKDQLAKNSISERYLGDDIIHVSIKGKHLADSLELIQKKKIDLQVKPNKYEKMVLSKIYNEKKTIDLLVKIISTEYESKSITDSLLMIILKILVNCIEYEKKLPKEEKILQMNEGMKKLTLKYVNYYSKFLQAYPIDILENFMVEDYTYGLVAFPMIKILDNENPVLKVNFPAVKTFKIDSLVFKDKAFKSTNLYPVHGFFSLQHSKFGKFMNDKPVVYLQNASLELVGAITSNKFKQEGMEKVMENQFQSDLFIILIEEFDDFLDQLQKQFILQETNKEEELSKRYINQITLKKVLENINQDKRKSVIAHFQFIAMKASALYSYFYLEDKIELNRYAIGAHLNELIQNEQYQEVNTVLKKVHDAQTSISDEQLLDHLIIYFKDFYYISPHSVMSFLCYKVNGLENSKILGLITYYLYLAIQMTGKCPLRDFLIDQFWIKLPTTSTAEQQEPETNKFEMADIEEICKLNGSIDLLVKLYYRMLNFGMNYQAFSAYKAIYDSSKTKYFHGIEAAFEDYTSQYFETNKNCKIIDEKQKKLTYSIQSKNLFYQLEKPQTFFKMESRLDKKVYQELTAIFNNFDKNQVQIDELINSIEESEHSVVLIRLKSFKEEYETQNPNQSIEFDKQQFIFASDLQMTPQDYQLAQNGKSFEMSHQVKVDMKIFDENYTQNFNFKQDFSIHSFPVKLKKANLFYIINQHNDELKFKYAMNNDFLMQYSTKNKMVGIFKQRDARKYEPTFTTPNVFEFDQKDKKIDRVFNKGLCPAFLINNELYFQSQAIPHILEKERLNSEIEEFLVFAKPGIFPISIIGRDLIQNSKKISMPQDWLYVDVCIFKGIEVKVLYRKDNNYQVITYQVLDFKEDTESIQKFIFEEKIVKFNIGTQKRYTFFTEAKGYFFVANPITLDSMPTYELTLTELKEGDTLIDAFIMDQTIVIKQNSNNVTVIEKDGQIVLSNIKLLHYFYDPDFEFINIQFEQNQFDETVQTIKYENQIEVEYCPQVLNKNEILKVIEAIDINECKKSEANEEEEKQNEQCVLYLNTENKVDTEENLNHPIKIMIPSNFDKEKIVKILNKESYQIDLQKLYQFTSPMDIKFEISFYNSYRHMQEPDQLFRVCGHEGKLTSFEKLPQDKEQLLYRLLDFKILKDVSVDKIFDKYKNKVPSTLKSYKERLNRLSEYWDNKVQFIKKNTIKDDENLYKLIYQYQDTMGAHLKSYILENILGVNKDEDDEVQVQLNREKAHNQKNSDFTAYTGENSLFQMMKSQFPKDGKHIILNSERPFEMKFYGEGGIDAGGLFREALTEISMEIQSEFLPILIPCANQRASHGDNRDKWIINSISKGYECQEMFIFFGQLIAFGIISSKNNLNLDLAPLFWKQLVGQKVSRKDIKAIDEYFEQDIAQLEMLHESMKENEEEFNESLEKYFVLTHHDGSEEELKDGGKLIRVEHSNTHEYINLIIQKKLDESQEQMKWIRQGINKIIKIPELLKMFSWKEMEERVQGRKTVKFSDLKRILVIKPQFSQKFRKWYTEILEEFTEDQLKQYLKFVWGRTSLPSDLNSCEKHKVLKVNDKEQFPVGHTCFFNIDVPEYSSKQLLKDRLMFAMENTAQIDADEDPWEDEDFEDEDDDEDY